MGGKFIDYTGKRFGRWLVVGRSGSDKNGHSLWSCVCDCGNKKIISGDSLKRGTSRSCGCVKFKHGLTNSRIYQVYCDMKNRCTNVNNKTFKHYGGRGIKICTEWSCDYPKGLIAFTNWALANGYKDGLTIDRINNDGDYEPGNCRWVNMVVQCNNRSNSCTYNVNGEENTIAELSRLYNINAETLRSRIKRGLTGLDIIKPVERRRIKDICS